MYFSVMKITVLALLTLIPLISWSQDSLMLKTGEMIPFVKLYQYDDAIELKAPYSKERISYYPDDVFGYYDILNQQSYYLLLNPEKEDNQFKHVFLERTTAGAIDVYIDNQRDYKMYLNKNGKTHLIYRTLEPYSSRKERIDTLKQLVIDDNECIDYIESHSFKLKPTEIQLVINQYNQRNFVDIGSTSREVTKQVFLYRTKFQKTKGVVRIWLNGKPHKLYIEDFIQVNIPVKYSSRITITDGTVSTDKIISANLAEQYFEVLYDSKTNSYLLDPKSGSELHFEFNRIKEKIEKRTSK